MNNAVKQTIIVSIFGVIIPAGGYTAYVYVGSNTQSGAGTESVVEVPAHGERQLVYVLLTASFCGSTRNPELRSALRTIPARLNTILAQHDRLWTIGISLDWDPAAGSVSLSDLGSFDEVIVGGNWFNTGVLQYVWQHPTRASAIPQIVLISRTIHRAGGVIRIGEEQELLRLVGSREILDWLNDPESTALASLVESQ